ncbi:MAG: hypothetical protein KF806_05885 [Nitrospira sp.]|nr:hypothetical protein [Nitrospira sp.]
MDTGYKYFVEVPVTEGEMEMLQKMGEPHGLSVSDVIRYFLERYFEVRAQMESKE